MRDETRRSLELFVEKAAELRSRNFAKYLADGGRVNLHVSLSSEHEEKVEYNGPDDEAMSAFLLILRFFIQDKDYISIRYLEKTVCNDPGLSASWKQEVQEARNHLCQYLDRRVESTIVYEPPPTRQEVLDTFLYGHLVHAYKEEHRERFKRWRQNAVMFSLYKMEFHTILYTLFSLIMYISALNEQELKAQAVSPKRKSSR